MTSRVIVDGEGSLAEISMEKHVIASQLDRLHARGKQLRDQSGTPSGGASREEVVVWFAQEFRRSTYRLCTRTGRE